MAEVSRNRYSTMGGSLAGISLVIGTQIAISERPGPLLIAAACCFAVAIPELVRAYLRAPIRDNISLNERRPEEIRAFRSFSRFVFLDIVGFVLIFFHVQIIAGLLFTIFVTLSLRFYIAPVLSPDKTMTRLIVNYLLNTMDSIKQSLRTCFRS